MAKRILICDDLGNVVRTMSARHNDAREEAEHALAFAHDNIELLERDYPGITFHAFAVCTRRSEDEATLHGDLHRLRAELKPAADGGVECLDVALAASDPVVTGEGEAARRRFVGHNYSICTARPARVDRAAAADASARRKGRAVAAGSHADFGVDDLLRQLRGSP